MTDLEIHRLNNILGRELGRRDDGHPIFAWKNSDFLFFPAFKTGRKILRKIEMDVPVIGGGMEHVVEEMPVDEYKRDRQVRRLNTWYVTKWLSPEEFIWGWVGRHGDRPKTAVPQEQLEEMWNRQYPGADFPARGWRIPTDAYLPRWPNGPREPNEPDTRHFVACVREQTRLGFTERLQDMEAAEDRQEAAIDKRIADELRECVPAFANGAPGKRSGWISMPWSKVDRQR